MDDVRQNLIKEHALQRQQTAYWTSWIRNSVYNGQEDWTWFDRYDDVVNRLTIDNVAQYARHVLRDAYKVKAVLLPADAKLLPVTSRQQSPTVSGAVFVDRNGNNIWDTGEYDADRQPEDVYYFSEEIECKAKWDITKQWNLTAKPRNRQKPGALIKTKDDKQKAKLRNRNAERARQLGIEYVKKELVK